MVNRQNGDNKKRYKAIVRTLREMYPSTGPLPYSRIAYAIRAADQRTLDERTVVRWVVRLLVPPPSLWKGGPVLEPENKIRTKPNGDIDIRSVKRNKYLILHDTQQVRIVLAERDGGKEVVVL